MVRFFIKILFLIRHLWYSSIVYYPKVKFLIMDFDELQRFVVFWLAY